MKLKILFIGIILLFAFLIYKYYTLNKKYKQSYNDLLLLQKKIDVLLDVQNNTNKSVIMDSNIIPIEIDNTNVICTIQMKQIKKKIKIMKMKINLKKVLLYLNQI